MVVGGSIGAGRIDEGCDIRETARSFTNVSKLAQCKLLINEKNSKKAGITLEDCMGPIVVPQTARMVIAPPVVVEVPTVAKEIVPEAPVLPRTFSIACVLFNNVCKQELDEMVLRVKTNGGRLSVFATVYTNQHMIRQISNYLTENGAENFITITDNSHATTVDVTVVD
jgi:hypothetical protein